MEAESNDPLTILLRLAEAQPILAILVIVLVFLYALGRNAQKADVPPEQDKEITLTEDTLLKLMESRLSGGETRKAIQELQQQIDELKQEPH